MRPKQSKLVTIPGSLLYFSHFWYSYAGLLQELVTHELFGISYRACCAGQGRQGGFWGLATQTNAGRHLIYIYKYHAMPHTSIK